MLDQNIINQIKEVFSKLQNKITLQIDTSDHSKQSELEELLKQVASSSDKIEIAYSDKKSPAPSFQILYQGKENGIRFTGIPAGHEFSSLVLAILNSDYQGKLPDQVIIDRIKRLKGPIKLKTYISLSCENCPIVVQALNIMAIFHPDFEHEMVDGEYFQDEIDKLKIQGVPTVTYENTMVSSGKNDLMGLIEKLEEHFAKDENIKIEKRDLGEYDVAIMGAGPAGVSSAIYASRKGLKTVIITDKMGGQLQETKGIENLISVPYTEGPELAAKLNQHMQEYDIEILEHRLVTSVKNNVFKELELNSGECLTTKALIIATGAQWRKLEVPGEKEYMGRGVAYCPHCDGPYYKAKDVAVVGGGNSGVEAAIDLAGIVKSVTVLEFLEELKADQVLIDKLLSLDNVKVIKNARSTEVVGDDEKVTALKYEDRASGEIKEIHLDGIFVQIGLVPNSEVVKGVVDMTPYGEIKIDEKCQTSVDGIYAAGDVTTVPYKQIVIAMGEGSKAALSAYEKIMLA